MTKQEFIDKHFRGCSPEYFDIVSSDLDAVIAGSVPTNDEIIKAAPTCPDADSVDVNAFNWFINGAKWVIARITSPNS